MFDIKDIKQIRKKLGLTQVDLAKRADVSQSLVAKIESGRVEPSYTNVRKIFDALSSVEDKSELKAADIMVKKIISCKKEDSVASVVAKMRRFQISQMPVMENKQVLGLISESTILDKIEGDVKILKAKDVMDEAPPIVGHTTLQRVVAHLLRHFPMVLVAKDGNIVGVITKSDILNMVSKVTQ